MLSKEMLVPSAKSPFVSTVVSKMYIILMAMIRQTMYDETMFLRAFSVSADLGLTLTLLLCRTR